MVICLLRSIVHLSFEVWVAKLAMQYLMWAAKPHNILLFHPGGHRALRGPRTCIRNSKGLPLNVCKLDGIHSFVQMCMVCKWGIPTMSLPELHKLINVSSRHLNFAVQEVAYLKLRATLKWRIVIMSLSLWRLDRLGLISIEGISKRITWCP